MSSPGDDAVRRRQTASPRTHGQPLVLASGSSYRRALLERLQLPFEVVRPDVDETPRQGETPDALAQRLAADKAVRVAADRHDALVIGSDQIAVDRGVILGKPGSHDKAMAQLQAASGRAVSFLTAVCLVNAQSGDTQTHVDLTRVHFRHLSHAEIERYLELEPAYDCAGSFKCEGLGVALFERIETADPTALQGLPLIWLAGALTRAGLPPL